MKHNPFLISLQDLVFGLFGGVALLVIVLSTFEESESTIVSDFVFVEVVWNPAYIQQGTGLASLAQEVKLRPTVASAAGPGWLYWTDGSELAQQVKRGSEPKSHYYAGPVGTVAWTLDYPEAAIEQLDIRTKRGVTRYQSGTSIRIETVLN